VDAGAVVLVTVVDAVCVVRCVVNNPTVVAIFEVSRGATVVKITGHTNKLMMIRLWLHFHSLLRTRVQ
jgi:hypothetical protein